MIKKCYVLDGKIINIGEWDYMKDIDEEGKEIINNPLPVEAKEEEREFEYSEDRGWFEVGIPNEPTQQERIKELEDMVLYLIMNGGI